MLAFLNCCLALNALRQFSPVHPPIAVKQVQAGPKFYRLDNWARDNNVTLNLPAGAGSLGMLLSAAYASPEKVATLLGASFDHKSRTIFRSSEDLNKLKISEGKERLKAIQDALADPKLVSEAEITELSNLPTRAAEDARLLRLNFDKDGKETRKNIGNIRTPYDDQPLQVIAAKFAEDMGAEYFAGLEKSAWKGYSSIPCGQTQLLSTVDPTLTNLVPLLNSVDVSRQIKAFENASLGESLRSQGVDIGNSPKLATGEPELTPGKVVRDYISVVSSPNRIVINAYGFDKNGISNSFGVVGLQIDRNRPPLPAELAGQTYTIPYEQVGWAELARQCVGLNSGSPIAVSKAQGFRAIGFQDIRAAEQQEPLLESGIPMALQEMGSRCNATEYDCLLSDDALRSLGWSLSTLNKVSLDSFWESLCNNFTLQVVNQTLVIKPLHEIDAEKVQVPRFSLASVGKDRSTGDFLGVKEVVNRLSPISPATTSDILTNIALRLVLNTVPQTQPEFDEELGSGFLGWVSEAQLLKSKGITVDQTTETSCTIPIESFSPGGWFYQLLWKNNFASTNVLSTQKYEWNLLPDYLPTDSGSGVPGQIKILNLTSFWGSNGQLSWIELPSVSSAQTDFKDFAAALDEVKRGLGSDPDSIQFKQAQLCRIVLELRNGLGFPVTWVNSGPLTDFHSVAVADLPDVFLQQLKSH